MRSFAAAVLALTGLGCLHEPYVPRPCVRPDLSGCISDSDGT